MRGLDDEVHPVGGNIHPGYFVYNLVDLGDDDTLFELGGLHNDRGILSVGSSIQVALPVRLVGGDKGDTGNQVDKVAAEKFQVGVDIP